MNKLPIKKLVEFRRFSEQRRSNFATKLKTPVEAKPKGDGGNYWVRSISALSTSFKFNDNSIIRERLQSLEEDLAITELKRTKVMYQRNIDILYNYEDYDFSDIRPSDDLTFHSKPIYKSLLEINGIPVQILPNHVFSYGDDKQPNIGSIWFVTWLDGFKVGDLGIYSEVIYRYLSKHYSKDFTIVPEDCMVMDASSTQVVTYKQIIEGEVPSLLDSTLATLRGLL